ncbi:hypothetical protein N7468_001443 [Penicillium chermesinum]|uniref:Citrate transporter-like domain-containing protein n=1 Tax=Penicillium chermesinum TaxID=63820 RepID=A0A9W9TWS5_9EURO|nr:uncharacterized protein N7468_001443 [Penicillium chermesinum]KAJ5246460.1 hypothetical protein N7468_001443 [Penicillium chermesinum]
MPANNSLDTSEIKNWRSIITLIVFVVTNIIVLFPFHVPIYIPRWLYNAILSSLYKTRIIPRPKAPQNHEKQSLFVALRFPLNFVTAPLIADLFLLAILAIGRQEVHDGTVGADNIVPLDIMGFFLTLAYIAISIDASGLIRYLAFKVLQKGGDVGHRLFFYLYAFFFILGSFIGNDPIILSGTAFLAYMTRVSSNIVHPRAWIHSQFAVANIASAILVSSNPTNLVLAGAFQIKFIVYTANMIVPVVVTAIVVFPFLLYILFADLSLIPVSIKMHELSEEAKKRKPVNPNIPHARGNAELEEEEEVNNEQGKTLSLEEIMNPFLDKKGAGFGALIMAATLITLLALNAASNSGHERPVFWVTLPAAFVMFCFDVGMGWLHRHETREIAARGRREIEIARTERWRRESAKASPEQPALDQHGHPAQQEGVRSADEISLGAAANDVDMKSPQGAAVTRLSASASLSDSQGVILTSSPEPMGQSLPTAVDPEKRDSFDSTSEQEPATLWSLVAKSYRWMQETFPTVTVVALVTKGWVPVFAYGWDHWVNKTGTVGAIGGMAFLSVILCNFAGTNIGTTILLSRVIQAWMQIHRENGIPISDRTFWATVYSMAIGVNFGAFSTAFSASLAGLLWRDILARKHIRVGSLEFARVNLPIIAITMAVGCTVLVGEVYIIRSNKPYDA